jgi:Fe-S-cluster containining protein
MLEKELLKIYALYERELQAWIASYARGVSCRKGCGTCCNMSVGLYLPEAIVLANLLTDAQYANVAEHAKRVLTYAHDTPDYLAGYRHAAIGWCPFLDIDSGSCSIYERRPANCRHVFSNMPPEYCVKERAALLEQHPEKRVEFLQQLDPQVNDDDLPFIAPLQDIFHEKYEMYLMILAAKYFNFIVYGEMSWLITLAREHRLWNLATEPGARLADFRKSLQATGWYHDNLLTDCQEVLPEIKEQSRGIQFTNLPL